MIFTLRLVVFAFGGFLIFVSGDFVSPPPGRGHRGRRHRARTRFPTGGEALFAGLGAASAKSAALSLVSSLTSSRVGQPAAIERVSDMPLAIAGAGVPTADPRPAVPVTAPQATQSTPAQQAAPPAGFR